MADLSDVSDALVSFITGVVYPSGTGQPSAVAVNYGSGAVAVPIAVFPGWPLPAQLDADMAANKIDVSVFPREEHLLPLTFADPDDAVLPVPTLTLTLNGQQVTVGGTITATPQNACVMANGKPYIYQTVQADTLTAVAAVLAALIAVDLPGTTSAGPVLTLPALAHGIRVRAGTQVSVLSEVRRQNRAYQITVWANRYDARDSAAKLIDVPLSGQIAAHGQRTALRLTMPDGSTAIVRYQRSHQEDGVQKQVIYRRDLFYTVEFVTTAADIETQILTIQESVTPPNAPTINVIE